MAAEFIGKIWIEIRSRKIYGLFREVWESLPAAVKNDSQKYITKVTDLSIHTPRRFVTGETRHTRSGSEIYLYSRRLRDKSDEYIRHTIAHEIAHGIFHNEHKRQVEENGYLEKELWADDCAYEWGFPAPDQAKERRWTKEALDIVWKQITAQD